jgi:hypothetical protein
MAWPKREIWTPVVPSSIIYKLKFSIVCTQLFVSRSLNWPGLYMRQNMDTDLWTYCAVWDVPVLFSDGNLTMVTGTINKLIQEKNPDRNRIHFRNLHYGCCPSYWITGYLCTEPMAALIVGVTIGHFLCGSFFHLLRMDILLLLFTVSVRCVNLLCITCLLSFKSPLPNGKVNAILAT